MRQSPAAGWLPLRTSAETEFDAHIKIQWFHGPALIGSSTSQLLACVRLFERTKSSPEKGIRGNIWLSQPHGDSKGPHWAIFPLSAGALPDYS